MNMLPADMEELHRQLERGAVQRAYRALIGTMQMLRTQFASTYGDQGVSGLYQGYLDMTYFALFPPALKRHGLKVAIVFNYTAFRFEVWLAARNRSVQRQYWERFRSVSWPGSRVVTPADGIDAIVECDLAEEFNLGDPTALRETIVQGTAAFVARVERFLAAQPTGEA